MECRQHREFRCRPHYIVSCDRSFIFSLRNLQTSPYDQYLPLPIYLSLLYSYMEMLYQYLPRQFPIIAMFKLNIEPIYLMHGPMPPFVLQSLKH